MNITSKILFSALAMMVANGALAQSSEKLLLSGWKFHKGSADNAQEVRFDDSKWQSVTIPHDWAISGPFDKEIDKQMVAIVQNGETEATEKTGRSGSLPWIGEGWYRTDITIPDGYANGELIFDGAMAEPHVWIDGKDLGYWGYGYNTFSLELSKVLGQDGKLKPGTYKLAVHLQNLEESSRWYPGAGLYRPVRLVLHKEMYLQTWGTFARTSSLTGISADASTAKSARILVSTKLNKKSWGKLKIVNTLSDKDGNTVATDERLVWKDFDGTNSAFDVANPKLWSPEHPYLYTLKTELKEGDKLWDMQETKIGIRTIEVTSDGFKLNGQVRKIKGVCLHHDLGPLGAAFNKDAFRRQVKSVKALGADAIRTSHNMPEPWQVDICDEMGMMMMAESFDMWKYPKCKNGYARLFDKVDNSVNSDGNEWWQRDITNLVIVNRNHPSIVMWSIGNEIPEQNSPDGVYYAKKMQDLIHSLDETRPCTQGMDHGVTAMDDGLGQVMDIPGWNYRVHTYTYGEKNSPKGIILGSETASTVSSRGVYKFPVKEEIQATYPDGQVSSYDIEQCNWSNLPDDDWVYQDLDPHVIGEFVWTGFDYLGEPTPYDEYWPSRSSYFGIYDLAGLPKDRAFLYRIHWAPEKETVHLLPHWTWPGREGQVTPVYCYTNYPEAELFVNGKSQGKRTRQELTLEEYQKEVVELQVPWGKEKFSNPDAEKNRLDRYRLRWNDVVYEPGEIKVVAYDKNGKAVAEQIVKTAGKPHHIELVSDRKTMPKTPTNENGEALDCPSMTFVTAKIVDKDGNLCPDADAQLTFSVTGTSAKFNSCCNGDATSLETFTNPTMKAFHGELVIVLEGTSKPGLSTLTVSAKGLKPGKANVTVE